MNWLNDFWYIPVIILFGITALILSSYGGAHYIGEDVKEAIGKLECKTTFVNTTTTETVVETVIDYVPVEKIVPVDNTDYKALSECKATLENLKTIYNCTNL